MNKLDTSAYKHAFEAIFNQVKKSHPEFRVGKTLNGIIADWSDTQLQGLQAAIGEEEANKVVKGCQVWNFRPNQYHIITVAIFYWSIGTLPTLCKESQRKGQQGLFNSGSSGVRNNWICHTKCQDERARGDTFPSIMWSQNSLLCYSNPARVILVKEVSARTQHWDLESMYTLVQLVDATKSS